ncbi:MAG: SDR family oxidoreductase [Magnetococcales bacterium]|nr:SDR family oxidoreductase [Magnetococcales bacterium]
MDTHSRRVFLTGGTGYVGKHVLARLLVQGWHVFALVRAANGDNGQRIFRALKPFSECTDREMARLHILIGDVTQTDCGLTGETIDRLRGLRLDAFVHCAGLTRFEEQRALDVYRVNTLGTRAAFSLCRGLDVSLFIHASTAFVAGDTTSPFYHFDFDRGQGFRNPYERSKFEAERYLFSEASGSPIRVRIHRLAIVVGGFPLGEEGDVGTLYAFLKALEFLHACCRLDLEQGRGRMERLGVRRMDDTLFIPVRVAAVAEVCINLVAIDHVVAVVERELMRPGTDSILVRHVVAAEGIALKTLRDTFCRIMGMTGITFCDPDDFRERPRTSLEGRFHRATRAYDPYLQETVHFRLAPEEAAWMPPEPVDPAVIARQFLSQRTKRRECVHQRNDCCGTDREFDQGTDRCTVPIPMNLGRLALDALGIDDPERYFEGLVRGDFGTDFLHKNRFVTASIRFVVTGPVPFDRTLCFSRGVARFPSSGERMIPECTFTLALPTFRAIVRCELDPRQAFFRGRIHIAGNRETGLKFAHLLSQYYARINDHVLDEVAGLAS